MIAIYIKCKLSLIKEVNRQVLKEMKIMRLMICTHIKELNDQY